MYVPGSSEKHMKKATTLPADVLIFDLEDAVAPDAKDAARHQVRRCIGVFTLPHNSFHPPFSVDTRFGNSWTIRTSRCKRGRSSSGSIRWTARASFHQPNFRSSSHPNRVLLVVSTLQVGPLGCGRSGRLRAHLCLRAAQDRRTQRRASLPPAAILLLPPHPLTLNPPSSSPYSAQVVELLSSLNRAGGQGARVWCMIETPRGVLRCDAIADSASEVECLVAGTQDLTKELQARYAPGRAPLLYR